jgi:CBS-domain-containing membrane protein
VVVEGPASSVQAVELPAGEAYQMTATVVAETANENSMKSPTMVSPTAASAIDLFAVLPGERWKAQDYSRLAGVSNYSAH